MVVPFDLALAGCASGCNVRSCRVRGSAGHRRTTSVFIDLALDDGLQLIEHHLAKWRQVIRRDFQDALTARVPNVRECLAAGTYDVLVAQNLLELLLQLFQSMTQTEINVAGVIE